MERRISINAQHAKVRTLGRIRKTTLLPGQKKQIIIRNQRRPSKKLSSSREKLSPAYSTALNLAQLLFPANFPKIIATGVKENNETHSRITFSERVHLTNESQSAIEYYYEWKHKALKPDSIFLKHAEKYQAGVKRFREKLREIGIITNNSAMNFGATKRGLVFFEVEEIHLPKITAYVKALPENGKKNILKKKQAFLMLEFLRKHSDQNGIVHAHIHWK